MYVKCHCGFKELPERDSEKMKSFQIKTENIEYYFDKKEKVTIDLKVCPKCNLVYLDGWFT